MVCIDLQQLATLAASLVNPEMAPEVEPRYVLAAQRHEPRTALYS
jgi:hypothetical protein